MAPQTLRKRIQRVLAFEEAIGLNILLSVTDRRGLILSANQKFCDVSQYTEEELAGKSHNIVNAGFHPKAFFADMWASLLEGNIWKGEIKNISKYGGYYWVDAVIVPVADKDGAITEFMSLGVLISKSKDAETALADAAFALSHKVRHPLVNMQALLTFILLEEMSMAEMKNMSKLMQEELDKIDALTRQMAVDLHSYRLKLREA